MKILRIQATFGKLENQTLELQPGLNVISAPNEWGKTTWCNFLVTMLYGLDTREKTTKTTVAMKERYAPWSGSPMSGRIDLEWEGRAITIQRWSKGRTPLGEFKAYETESGLEIPELLSSNCGEMLLGVEKSVFLRSGFLRLADLPVTADDALRRRLNALVTTGDDSGDADTLAQKLKDLKNKCRSNRTNGLIPQAEVEKADIEEKLQQISRLQDQARQLQQRQEDLKAQLAALENHAQALEYAAAEDNLRRIREAEDAARLAQIQLSQLEQTCRELPRQEDARQKFHALQELQQKQQQARLDAGLLPPAPQPPQPPMCFYGLTGEEALRQVREDQAQYLACQASLKQARKPSLLWAFTGAVAAVIGIGLLCLRLWIPGAAALAASIGLLLWQFMSFRRFLGLQSDAVAAEKPYIDRYGTMFQEEWMKKAQHYAGLYQEYEAAMEAHALLRQQNAAQIARLDQALETATEGRGLSAAMEYYSDAIRQRAALADAQKNCADAQKYAENLAAMAKTVEKPTQEDRLTHSAQQTRQLLEESHHQMRQLQSLLGQCQGRMDALGSESALLRELEAVNARLDKLNLYYNALELAQKNLQTATDSLQRRFAPRITQQAKALFGQLTGGRYDKLNLTQELTVDTATEDEAATRSIQLRSDGTVDQLYLALRLAVARELTPAAPLVLDDALVRFDDARHGLAMEVLRREAEAKQIILFTCQSRECP